MTATAQHAVGAKVTRLEGRDKVTGKARYAMDYTSENPAFAWVVQSPIPRGQIVSVDIEGALGSDGVVAVLWHGNTPTLVTDDPELAVLQSDRVSYRGQVVALVVAESIEAAKQGSQMVRLDLKVEDHDVTLAEDSPLLYSPEKVNPNFPADTEAGDPDTALANADVVVDARYRTPSYHNNPMEPHATMAVWQDDNLIVYDSNQGASPVQAALAKAFSIDKEQVRVVSTHVGGGFGSKGTPRPIVVLAALAARKLARPVKLAATRQQMFAFVGYRTPTIQRVRLGSNPDGTLTAIVHDVVEQTSQLSEFAEQTAVITRSLYRSANRRTTHRLARLDVPTPSWMRAPGEAPGSFALESAIDELAFALGIDPVELRARNEPDSDPESGQRFSSRNLLGCLSEGARRFGWDRRDPRPCVRRDGRWLVGSGVASSAYPARVQPSKAAATALDGGTFHFQLAAADIGTGARTALTQIAADALGVPLERVSVSLGDSALPEAPLAGGSMGTGSWGWAICKAAEALSEGLKSTGGQVPQGGLRVEVDTSSDVADQPDLARYAYGAQFVEARVDIDTGEVRIPRMVGVFAAGRIVNPLTARSQLIGGMTMGLSMALLEESIIDPRVGGWVNTDLADYHIASYADIGDIDVSWLDEDDPDLNPVGTKGIGEIGIVGTAAAVANAVHHAVGIRVRDLPIRLDKLVTHSLSSVGEDTQCI